MLGPDMRARIKILGFESFFNLFEGVSPQLTPEDPSQEAYWVAHGNWCRAGSQQLGRL